MGQAIEVAIFKAKAAAVAAILRGMPGCIGRNIGVWEHGQYLDIVSGKVLSAAKTAADKAMRIPGCLEYFGLVAESEMRFMHYTAIE